MGPVSPLHRLAPQLFSDRGTSRLGYPARSLVDPLAFQDRSPRPKYVLPRPNCRQRHRAVHDEPDSLELERPDRLLLVWVRVLDTSLGLLQDARKQRPGL